MQRYIRAFYLALKITLQGKRVLRPYDSLHTWMEQANTLATASLHRIQAAGLQDVALKIEGRELAAHTILRAVVYHTGEEYPYVLQHMTEHSLTAIYASNMNDQFNVLRLRDSETVTAAPADVQQALNALYDHLNSIPSSTSLEAQPTVKA